MYDTWGLSRRGNMLDRAGSCTQTLDSRPNRTHADAPVERAMERIVRVVELQTVSAQGAVGVFCNDSSSEEQCVRDEYATRRNTIRLPFTSSPREIVMKYEYRERATLSFPTDTDTNQPSVGSAIALRWPIGRTNERTQEPTLRAHKSGNSQATRFVGALPQTSASLREALAPQPISQLKAKLLPSCPTGTPAGLHNPQLDPNPQIQCSLVGWGPGRCSSGARGAP